LDVLLANAFPTVLFENADPPPPKADGWPAAGWVTAPNPEGVPKTEDVAGAPNADWVAGAAGAPNADWVAGAVGVPNADWVAGAAGAPNADWAGAAAPKDGCPNTDGFAAKAENADEGLAVDCPNTGAVALAVLLENALPLELFENTDPPVPKADVWVAPG